MLRATFILHRNKIPLPPRRVVSDNPHVLPEPYFSIDTFQWGDPLLSKAQDYVGRAVKLQRKIMSKAGVSDARKCNQVEVEMRLGQITSRKVVEKVVTTNAEGKDDEGGRKGLQKGGSQSKSSEPLLRLPVATPAVIDEQACSFISGFKVLGRCDPFFTVPLRQPGSRDTFTESRNRFTDQRVFDWEVFRGTTSVGRRKLVDDGDDIAAESKPLMTSSVTDPERDFLSNIHRMQSSVEAEKLLPEAAQIKGYWSEGAGHRITIGATDEYGSDQLPAPPAAWVRKAEVVRPSSVDGSPSVYRGRGGVLIECHGLTSDGLRVEFTNGVVTSAGPRADDRKVIRDRIQLEKLKRGQKRRALVRKFREKLEEGDVRSSLEQGEGGIRDVAFNHEFTLPDQDYKGGAAQFLLSQLISYEFSRIATKTNVAHCNLRMPQWSCDTRMSVSIERTENDDKTPFAISRQEMFPLDIDRTFGYDELERLDKDSPERGRLEERLNRDITVIRFSKRVEYSLVEYALGFETMRAYRIGCVLRWFNLPPPRSLDRTVTRDSGLNPMLDLEMKVMSDPIADTFLRLFVTDVYASVDPGHARGHRTELLSYADFRAAVTQESLLLTKPNQDDSRSREVEVEINMPALVDAVVAHEARLEDALGRVDDDATLGAGAKVRSKNNLRLEAEMQLNELYALVSMRMMDALGSFSRLP